MYEMGKKINYEENVFYFPSWPKGDYIYMEACFQCCQLLSRLVKISQLMAVIIKDVLKIISLELGQQP